MKVPIYETDRDCSIIRICGYLDGSRVDSIVASNLSVQYNNRVIRYIKAFTKDNPGKERTIFISCHPTEKEVDHEINEALESFANIFFGSKEGEK